MRKTKFRAKSKANDLWVYGFYYELPTGESFIVDDRGTGWGVDKNTVGQSTGLKYKYGKEIYEGDIVNIELEIGNDQGMPVFESQEGVVVVWNFEFLFQLECADRKEIIGNIFDNPELIEAQQ